MLTLSMASFQNMILFLWMVVINCPVFVNTQSASAVASAVVEGDVEGFIPIQPIFFPLQPNFYGSGEGYGGPGQGARQKCYEKLGCFHPIPRRFGFYPNDRERIGTKFYLFTRNNPGNKDALSAWYQDSIQNSHFAPFRRTVVIIHGWLDGFTKSTWMQRMKDELLDREDYNVILADWERGSGHLLAQSAANVQVVGAEVAELVSFLNKDFGVPLESFHLIGFGLGAQGAGLAGGRINRPGRITALDPTLLYFRHYPNKDRLDRDDANFVDVVFTNGGGLFENKWNSSKVPQTGHVDFFVNGGFDQPGCIRSSVDNFLQGKFLKGLGQIVMCSHKRAIEYYIKSINDNGCRYVGVSCRTKEEYESGRCGDCNGGVNCSTLGHEADLYNLHSLVHHPRRFILVTHTEEPYCTAQYYLLIKVNEPKRTAHRIKIIILTMHGTGGSQEYKLRPQPIEGLGFAYIISNPKDIGYPTRFRFEWRSWGSQQPIDIRCILVSPINFANPHESYWPVEMCSSTEHNVPPKTTSDFFTAESYSQPVSNRLNQVDPIGPQSQWASAQVNF